MEYKRTYEYNTEKGAKVKINIGAKIENPRKEDVKEILREFAMRSRDFYLGLGKKIAGMNL